MIKNPSESSYNPVDCAILEEKLRAAKFFAVSSDTVILAAR
jgi:hypothetical protein